MSKFDEQINEVLTKDQPAGEWIADFVKSDNPKFAGKSAEKRKQMALAAYYAAKKNESTDYESFIEYTIEDYSIDELEEFMMSEEFEDLNEISKDTLASYVKKASKQAVGSAVSANQFAGYVSSAGTAKGKQKWYKDSDEAKAKSDKRLKGIARAADKLANEKAKMESVESLVSSILDGEESAAMNAFNVAMAEKLQARLDDMKVDIAREL